MKEMTAIFLSGIILAALTVTLFFKAASAEVEQKEKEYFQFCEKNPNHLRCEDNKEVKRKIHYN